MKVLQSPYQISVHKYTHAYTIHHVMQHVAVHLGGPGHGGKGPFHVHGG